MECCSLTGTWAAIRRIGFARLRLDILWLWILIIFVMLTTVPVYAADLSSLLGNGGEVTLDPASSYTVRSRLQIPADTIIHGNGATIQILYKDQSSGPIVVSGKTLQIEQANIVGASGLWGALAIENSGQLIVKSSTISCAGGIAIYIHGDSSTILDDTTIQDSTYGINATETTHLTLSQVSFSNCLYSFQQDQGDLDWNGGTVRQDQASAVYLAHATAAITSVSVIQDGADSYAFNFDGSQDRNLHNITVNGSKYGVLISGGTTTIDQNSTLKSNRDDGVGVAVMNGARLVMRDTTIRRFQNGVDVQPSTTTQGTADITNCTFYDQSVSALCAVNAVNTRIANSYIQGTAMDGIYFEKSSGSLIDNCMVMYSLNTGVTFLNCPYGGTIQNSLVQGSAHQGVAVTDGSAKIRITGNTLIGNIICNILVDQTSKAFIQGNILTGTPDFNVRLQGTRSTKLESNLIAYSFEGVEVKETANPTFTLSAIANNSNGGILAYENSTLALNGVYLKSNNLKDKGSYSIFINEGARATLRASRIGPRANKGLYNNAGTTCDVTTTYWDSSDGPAVAGGGQGSGALVDWNSKNGSNVLYKPYKKAPPIVGNWTNKLTIAAGGNLTWKSSAGVTIALTASPNASTVSGQVAGALRAADTSLLGSWKIPAGLIKGQVYTVWLGQGLRWSSSSGSLVFRPPGYGGSVQLKRRTPSGSWANVETDWNPTTGLLTYSPANPQYLNGTFALVQG